MPELRHFSPHEFGKWWGDMRPELLDAIDAFREQWGRPVVIRFNWDGPHVAGRLGRHQGPDGTSDHNVDRWGEVRAIDCFPQGMDTRADAERAIALAEREGFNAIGVYPQTKPSPMLHLGQRPGEDRTAMWGALRGKESEPWRYVAAVVAMERMA